MTVRVFLVEDHALFASGVRSELGDGFEVVGHAATVAEAVEGVRATTPDVVLLDVHLPDGSGANVLEQVLASNAEVQFLADAQGKDNTTTEITSTGSFFLRQVDGVWKIYAYRVDRDDQAGAAPSPSGSPS